MDSLDLQDILQFTINLSRTAAALILEGSDAIHNGSSASDAAEKTNSVDLVTEYDVKVENMVFDAIKNKYPTFHFIGEEAYAAGTRPELTDQPTFCVDPIDGTTNFVHGFPLVCISIGLIVNKRVVLGVIYNPFLDQLWYATKDGGSYLEQRGKSRKLPLASPPKPLASLSQALIAVEWGNDRSLKPLTARTNSFSKLAADIQDGGRMVHSLRSTGSSVLNFAFVAQGSLDLYWEVGCYPWDVCAGIIIAQEAGALVSGPHNVFAEQSSSSTFSGEVTPEILLGRKYIVVRGMPGIEQESTLKAQKRIITEFYSTVENYTVKGLQS